MIVIILKTYFIKSNTNIQNTNYLDKNQKIMKKILMALMLCLVSICGFGQKTIGTYHNNYFDKDCYVQYSEKTNKYYIQIVGETKTRDCNFAVEDLDNFRVSLTEAKNKYVEWVKVAKENNVTKMIKNMNIVFSKGTFSWYETKWYFNFYAIPEPRFLITSDGDCLLLLFCGKEFKSSSNEYITENAYWVFSSVAEIEELENLISEETLKKFKENKEQNDTTYYDSYGNFVIEEYCDVCECTIRQVYYEYPELNSTSLFSMPWFEGEKCSDYNDYIYFDGGYIKTTCVYKRKEC